MTTRPVKLWKVIVFAILTALMLFLTFTFSGMTGDAFRTWQLNRMEVQERLYESVAMFYAYLQMLIFAVLLLAVCVRGLLRALRPPLRPDRLSLWLDRRGLWLALILAALFALFFVLDRAVLQRIYSTPETSEVPATLGDRRLSCRLQIGAELAAFGAVVSFVPGLRGAIRRRREK